MDQLSFASLDFAAKKKRTKRDGNKCALCGVAAGCGALQAAGRAGHQRAAERLG